MKTVKTHSNKCTPKKLPVHNKEVVLLEVCRIQESRVIEDVTFKVLTQNKEHEYVPNFKYIR